VTLLCPGPQDTGNTDGVHTVQASTTQLRIPAEPDAQQERQTRVLLGELVNRCVSGQEATQRETAAAKATITSMRNYAIERHRDGDICREGLNDFPPGPRPATVRAQLRRDRRPHAPGNGELRGR